MANEVEERAVELDSPGNVADEVEKRAVELDSPGDVTDDVEEQTDSASWSLMRKTSWTLLTLGYVPPSHG